MRSDRPVYLTSDVHLGAIPREREASFLRWLRYAAASAGEIVLNGDVFDFWFEFRRGVPSGYGPVLEALRQIAAGGTSVTLMGGNHDWWGGAYLRERIGVTFLREPTELVLAGRRTLLAHGDGLGPGDLSYRLLRLLLRGRLTRWAFGWLPPRLGSAIARRVSQTEDRDVAPGNDEKRRASFLRNWAEEKLRQDRRLDLVILGHTHLPELRQVEEDRWYLNAGDWVHHRSYAVLRPGRPPELLSWES